MLPSAESHSFSLRTSALPDLRRLAEKLRYARRSLGLLLDFRDAFGDVEALESDWKRWLLELGPAA